MKKIFCVTVIVLTLSIFSFASFSMNEGLNIEKVNFDIIINDNQETFDLPVVTINDVTYLPLRELCEKLNMKVEWYSEEKEINISKQQSQIFEGTIKPTSKPQDNDKSKTSLTLKDFSFLKKGMTLDEIFEKVGEPSYWEGSGMMWPVYILYDGTELHIRSYKSLDNFLQISDDAYVGIGFDDEGNIAIY